MVKSKNYLVKSQLALVFLIPVTPHIEISRILQLDDIPVLLFFVLFVRLIERIQSRYFYLKKLDKGDHK